MKKRSRKARKKRSRKVEIVNALVLLQVPFDRKAALKLRQIADHTLPPTKKNQRKLQTLKWVFESGAYDPYIAEGVLAEHPRFIHIVWNE
jgi:hypothetical protein